ncbi:MAG: hypothetical protein HY200_00395 [Nitrospirae bacterium]|nr:hypothetical protein [Nitrospirota bacterium]
MPSLSFRQLTFITATLDEGFSIQKVLGKVIRCYGIKEFSQKTGMASPNILRAINPKHNPTQETLNRLLKPFGLKSAVTSLQIDSKRATA